MAIDITTAHFDAYAAQVNGAGSLSEEIQLVKNTCSLLKSIAEKLPTLEKDAPITVGWNKNAYGFIKDLNVSKDAVVAVFQQLSLCVREMSLRSGMIDYKMIDVFDYIDREYGTKTGQHTFYEFYKYGVYKHILVDMYRGYNDKKAEIEKQIGEWREQLTKSETTVQDLKNQLESQHKQYNFVGLSRAFSNLLRTKKFETYVLLAGLALISLCILLVPYSLIEREEGFLTFLAKLVGAANKSGAEVVPYSDIVVRLFRGLPFLAIEIALVYFFRVLLHNYYNAKSQVVQLELRNALCQFVENYIDFAKQHEEKTITRFESLIFSDLERPTANVPAPIDLEQVVQLLKSGK